MKAIGAAAALADRFDRPVRHQVSQIAPGRGAAHLGETDGLAQGHATCESFEFGIQLILQPVSGRRFKVKALPADGAGENLHWSRIAQATDPNGAQAIETIGEQAQCH